jgi:hypothetical protein
VAVDLKGADVEGRVVPIDELLQIEIETHFEPAFVDRPLVDAARNIGEGLPDIFDAAFVEAVAQPGPIAG